MVTNLLFLELDGHTSPVAAAERVERGRTDGAIPGFQYFYGASVYHNLTAGYNIEPLNTRVDVGVDNLSDKQPAIISQTNTLNGNVDANTFDTIGRFYWARVTVKF